MTDSLTPPFRGRPLRQSMAWAHGWLGLVAGWILFAMFLTGTASYFRPEITRWMQPEHVSTPVPYDLAAQNAVAYLAKNAAKAEQWYIYLPGERERVIRVFVSVPKGKGQAGKTRAKRSQELMLDPATGEQVKARETRGGEHFYRFHFQLQLPHPWGRWLAGIAAMFMLTAIISGVITHKRIFADFFMLRWGKGQRSWLDGHNASAVLALPFHAMITYTGLVSLVAMYMPWPALATYKDPKNFLTEAYGQQTEGVASERAASLMPVDIMVRQAMQQWQGAPPRNVIIRHPGDATSTVTIIRGDTDQLDMRTPSIIFSGATGQMISRTPDSGSAVKTAGVMVGLHMGHFASGLLRWAYFLLGVSGAIMVGSGAVLWSIKRERLPQHFGHKLVNRLNIGAIACLPAGMAAYFLANRLLPSPFGGRMEMEVAAMFWTWFGLTGALLLVRPAMAWGLGFAASALLFALAALADLLTNENFSHDSLFAEFDSALLVCAATLGSISWLCLRRCKRDAATMLTGSANKAQRRGKA